MDNSSPAYEFRHHQRHSELILKPGMNDVAWDTIDGAGGKVVQEIESSSAPKVLVDLTPLDYIGSALVALVVRVWKSVEKKGGTFVVANQNKMVYEVLKIAGLTEVWTMADSREDAFKKMGVSSGTSSAPGGGASMMLLALGILAMTAAVALCALTFQPDPPLDARTLVIAICSAGGLGVLLGGALLVIPRLAWVKTAGAVIAIASLGCLVTGLLNNAGLLNK